MAIGGAQRVLLDQAEWFHARGYKTTAVFFYDRENLNDRWQAAVGFPIINLHAFKKQAGGIAQFFLLAGGLWRLWRLLRRDRPQVIEAFTHDANMLTLPLAWLLGIPVRIASHHGRIEGFDKLREGAHTWVVNHLSHGIVVVSNQTRQKALEEGIKPEKIVIIPNGIKPVELTHIDREAIRKEMGLNSQDIALLSVGRLVYQKAHEFLIAAMPQVLKTIPDVKAFLCGDGVLKDDLKKQIHKLSLEKHVILLGAQTNVPRYLAAADLFLLPSRWEGLPIALLEAMSAGLPVVATRVEGVDEVVVDGVHGLLVEPGSPEGLAKAILQLLTASGQRRRMSEAARERVLESYSVDQMCKQYLDLFLQRLG